jgi:O-antigen ligase
MKKLLTTNNLFLLTIFSMPLYLVRMNIFGLPLNVFELLAILAIVFSFFKERKKLPEIFFGLPKLLLISMALVLFGVLLSILFNDNYRAGMGIFKSWFLIPILFSFLLYVVLSSKENIEKVFLSIYLSIAAVGFIGIVYKILGIVTYDGRLEAFYSSPNYLAIYLSSGVFFGFYFLVKSFFEKAYSKKIFAHLFLVLIVLAALYFTYSYGAWLAVFLALFCTILVVAPQKKFLFSGLFFIVAATAFIFQFNTSKFSELVNFSQRSSFASRIMIWDASLLMIKQNPVFGIGPSNFQNYYLALQKYFPPYLDWAVPQPHNVFLAFWLQTGFLGLIGFLLLLFFVFKTLFKIVKNKKDAFLAAPLLGFFLYTVLHGLIDTTYWKNDFSFLFWINVFLLIYINTKL